MGIPEKIANFTLFLHPQRLKSRFGGGLITVIREPDYENRRRLLDSWLHEDGKDISSEVIDYIAWNVKSNISDLKGVLTQAIAYQALCNTEISLDNANSILHIGIKKERNNVVLLGDSIFDNGSYVNRNEDVTTHLRKIIQKDYKVTLCAVDGAMIDDVSSQLERIPDDATDLFLSIGGNDVLQYKNILTNNALTALEFLTNFAEVLDKFKSRYKEIIKSILKYNLPLTICTIYNGNLEEEIEKPARITVSLFNDIIYQVAREYTLPVIELRNICTNSSDYANPIEPSSIGGKKIAQAMNNIVGKN